MRFLPFLPLLVAAPMLVSAADAADNPIEIITVTAHRLPGNAGVLPVVTRDPGEAVVIGADALRGLPGVAINQAGSIGSLTQVRVRGSEANHLLVLVDGVEVMDPTTDAGFNFANLNLAGIDRLEFLPGAQSAVWGSDAVAGVLQLTTRPSAPARRLVIHGGSFATRGGQLRLADATDGFYYNVSAADFATDGTNIARSGSEEDGFDSTHLLLSTGVERDRFALRGLARQVETRSDFDPSSFVTGLPEDGDRQNRHAETLAVLGLDVRGRSADWQERLTVSWFDSANRTLASGVRTARLAGQRSEVSSVTRIPVSGNQHVELLLEHEREEFDQRGEPGPFGDPNQSQTIRTTSAGVEYFFTPVARVNVSASIRHDHSSEFTDSQSLRLILGRDLTNSARVWLAAGTGVKHPSFVERYGFTPDRFLGNSRLEAEQNRHLSVGLESRVGGWELSAALFRDRLEDEIDGFYFDPGAGAFTAVNQDGTSTRQGAEVSAAGRLGGADWQLGASYLDAQESDGRREIRRPRWQGYLRLDRPVGPFAAALELSHVGEQIDLDFATFPAPRVALDHYTLVNALLRLPIGARVDVSLRGSNLLDERYEDQLGYRAPGRAWYLQLGVQL